MTEEIKCDCGYESTKTHTHRALVINLRDHDDLNQAISDNFKATYNHRKCISCKSAGNISQKSTLKSIPEVLSIVLHRKFDYRHLMTKINVEQFISLNGGDLYELKASIVHEGPFSSGHYYAVNKYGAYFYQMNGESITFVDVVNLTDLEVADIVKRYGKKSIIYLHV